MLAAGWGFHIAIPPNLTHLHCLQAAEHRAKQQQAGVWGKAYFDAISATSLAGRRQGFARVDGVIDNISTAGKSWWLEMRGGLVLRIASAEQRYFDIGDLLKMKGARLIVKGWLVDRSQQKQVKKQGFKPWVMALKHPAALQGIELLRNSEQ